MTSYECEQCQLAVAHDSGTNSSQSGTRDGRQGGQFRDCPGHFGTVGNPTADVAMSAC